MQLEHSFTVPAAIDDAWEVLIDIERVAPCMPGAGLETVDGDDFTGIVKVKLGPIGLTYKGKASFIEKDKAAYHVVLKAQGRDARGNGTAAATVSATLTDAGGDTTKVVVTTDLDITGKPAQFGRGVMVDVGNKLIGQFADCLAGKLAGGAVAAEMPQAPAMGSVEAAGAAVDVTASPVAVPSAESETPAGSGTAAESGTAGSDTTAGSEPAESETPAPAAAPTANSEPATVALEDSPTVLEDSPTAAADAELDGQPTEDGHASAFERPKLAPAPADAGHGSGHPHVHAASSNLRHFAADHHIEPIDLLHDAGPAILKRLAPLGVIVVLVVVLWRRRR